MQKNKNISVALEVETYDRLKALATQDLRSVSSLARYIIKEYILGIENGSITLTSREMFEIC